MPEFLVVGLDGAGFQLLGNWIDDGSLPTVSRLQKEGTTGTLRSAYPPVTCPNWRCYSTGVNPGKHGVFWWENVDREKGTFTIPTAKDFDAPDIWDYLGEEGYTSAVVNMPTTFPPQPLNGYMISGGGGVDGNEYTYPPELQEEIEEQFDYRTFLNVTTSNIGEYPEKVDEILDLIEMRFEVADFIRQKYDPAFLHLTVFYTNVFNHHYWDADVTKRVWKRVDELLGEFIEDENIILMSDHGSNEIHHVFNINTWLESEGYLVTTETVSDRLLDFGITRERMTKFADKLGVKNSLKALLPQSAIDYVPKSNGQVEGAGKASKIDWERSTAMASGQGPIYVLATGREREQIREEIKTELESLSTPTGMPVARTVYRANEIYTGPHIKSGPDLVVDQADHIHISGAIGSDDLFKKPDNWIGENHRDGIFFATGPDIVEEIKLGQVDIYDITPTILHWFGTPVPEQLDGRVLTEIFDEGTDAATREVVRRDWSPDTGSELGVADQDQMRDRLQDLGYLS